MMAHERDIEAETSGLILPWNTNQGSGTGAESKDYQRHLVARQTPCPTVSERAWTLVFFTLCL
jgi:hypothetical protein